MADLYQTALDLAEQQRDYVNTYGGGLGYVPYAGTAGGEGGMGGTYNFDPSVLPAYSWNGPPAYDLTGAGTQFGIGDEANAYAQLARAQQFDPNASITTGVHGANEGGVESPYYQLNYDQSLVPAPVHPSLVGFGGYGSQNLYDPNQIFNDPNYGPMTVRQNVKPDTGFDWLSVLGPAAVGAFGFGIPAIAAGLTGGAIGGAAGSVGLPWWGNAGINTVRQVGSGDFNPVALAGSWAPGLTEFGVPSEVAQGLSYGSKAYNAYNAYDRGFQPQQQTQITYNPQNYGNLRQPLVPSGDTTPVAESFAYSPYYSSRNRGPSYG